MNLRNTFVDAYNHVLTFRKELVQALLIPIILLSVVGDMRYEPVLIEQYFIAITIVEFSLYVMLAIIIHRVLLLGSTSVNKWGLSVPNKRHIVFVYHMIITALLLIPVALLALIPHIGSIVAVMVSFYIVGRLSLVYPSVAIDDYWNLSDSWYATKNHQLLMVALALVFPVFMSIPEILFVQIPHIGAVSNFISALALVFTISCLSVVYKVISSEFKT